MQLNPQAQATASRRAVAKSRRIKELGITPKLTVKKQDKIVLALAEAKAIEQGKPMDSFVKGQEWYVLDLKEFSRMDATQRFEHEYAAAYHDVASKDEIVGSIQAYM